MFIAMNRFKVAPGREDDFETGWKRRESHLREFSGFVQFALLKGDEQGEYISHTTWNERADFLAWTNSEAFRSAHAGGLPEGTLADRPRVGFYEAVILEQAGPEGRE